LRASLTRVHPSFRFEEALAARLAEGAARRESGLPLGVTPAPARPGTLSQFRNVGAAAAPAPATAASNWRAISPGAAFRRLPEMAGHPSRPMIVGGVGVASAAISLGAVYVAWRHSHTASGRMGRAARAAHSRTSQSGRSRRSGVIHGIIGVVS
jgi:hypothetical protein